jgi:Spy/CpxP family protein refolding chaperone
VFIVGAYLLAVLIVGSFAFVWANERQWACDSGFHPPFHGKGPHFRFHSEKMIDRMLDCLDDRAERLDLTELQEVEYQAIREDIRDTMLQGLSDRKILKQEVQEELNRDNPDPAVLGDLIKTRIRAVSEAMEQGLDRFVSFYEILEPDQQAIILEKLREKAGRCEEDVDEDSDAEDDPHMDIS